MLPCVAMSRLLLPFLLPLAALAACNGDPKDTSEPPPLSLDDTAEDTDCDAHAPVVTEVLVENGGEHSFEGDMLPSLLVKTTAEDEDGDLDVMSVKLWWDTEVDDFVDTEGTPQVTGSPVQMRDLPCGVASGQYLLYLPVIGVPLAYSTTYEVAAKAADSHNVESEDYTIGVGTTPDENGN